MHSLLIRKDSFASIPLDAQGGKVVKCRISPSTRRLRFALLSRPFQMRLFAGCDRFPRVIDRERTLKSHLVFVADRGVRW
jgi:hypothetical protein